MNLLNPLKDDFDLDFDMRTHPRFFTNLRNDQAENRYNSYRVLRYTPLPNALCTWYISRVKFFVESHSTSTSRQCTDGVTTYLITINTSETAQSTVPATLDRPALCTKDLVRVSYIYCMTYHTYKLLCAAEIQLSPVSDNAPHRIIRRRRSCCRQIMRT